MGIISEIKIYNNINFSIEILLLFIYYKKYICIYIIYVCTIIFIGSCRLIFQICGRRNIASISALSETHQMLQKTCRYLLYELFKNIDTCFFIKSNIKSK
jgi:hypothetical protein